jgi:hypothetical protein
MTPIDYLLLAGALLAGGYVVARLFVGWLRSSTDNFDAGRGQELDAPIVPEGKLERVEKTDAPWHFRK